jgi:hypothetical protein
VYADRFSRGAGMLGGGGGVGGGGLLENVNPLIYERSGERPVTAGEEDEQVPDSIDAREIFDIRCCWAGARGLGDRGEKCVQQLVEKYASQPFLVEVLSGQELRVPFPSLDTSYSLHQ